MTTADELVHDATDPPVWRVLPVIVVVPAVNALLRWAGGGDLVGAEIAGVLAVASGAILGIPALFWSLSHRRSSLEWLLAMGLVGGALPIVIILLSGLFGLTLRHGWSDMMLVAERGAPLPWFGQVTWLRYSGFVSWAGFVGATSAVVQWALFITPRRRAGLLIAAGTLAAATGAAWWLR